MKFGVGVIGATGFVSTSYRQEIRAAKEDATIVALCARRHEQLAAAAREDGCAVSTDDWRAVVEHPDVNLVVVTTPDRLHHDPVLASALQGKHVFCDKPVGADAREAFEMWAAYRDRKLGHFVPFWTRYDPTFVRAKEVVGDGTLGEIKVVIYRWHTPRPPDMPFTWRDDATLSSAGSIGDVGSHAYDTVRWLIGSEARRVLVHADIIAAPKPDLGAVTLTEALAWSGTHRANEWQHLQRKGTAFDYATIAWEFENGAVGAIILSHAPVLRRGLAPDVELHGTQASLAVDRASTSLRIIPSGETKAVVVPVENPGSVNRFARYVFPALRQRAAGEPCAQPGLEDGWRVQIFTDAAALAARRGTWVELKELG
jgi:predicted dehydrogenase